MKHGYLYVLPLAAALALPGLAQQSSSTADQPPAATKSSSDTQLDSLKPQNREGFWGRMNPFARKKYVQKQVTPIRDRANELDELTAKNSRDIRDVDERATSGIRRADEHASLADQHASDAQGRAQAAHLSAQQANGKLQKVSNVVENLDQYRSESQVQIRFRPGTTQLTPAAKSSLDELAELLRGQKGYVLEVQGFTPGRGTASIQQSQHLADAVVRYLVIHHQVPVFRIYELGMGNATAEGSHPAARSSHVEVTLLRNNVKDLAAESATMAQTR